LNKIIDYSLLLGVIDIDEELTQEELELLRDLSQKGKLFYSSDKTKAYMMGIIDYF
jgi:hypothetical protein